ncbi:hypothetical protein C2845_PM02G18060 [Panicum miliaceum]|uniref:Uncharacterized protein n=1 Tax=Panicum miliaceum TaxID=4540 RepID=A0A3L6SGL5_PANMI|nr:hypothetical protein C2845_PM02G18060 [Panicum miliaceum]
MRVKQLMTSRMTGKKGATKGKGKESKTAATARDDWRTSKCFEADLQTMVDECLLQPKEPPPLTAQALTLAHDAAFTTELGSTAISPFYHRYVALARCRSFAAQ